MESNIKQAEVISRMQYTQLRIANRPLQTKELEGGVGRKKLGSSIGGISTSLKS
jgi:hypothetical protein